MEGGETGWDAMYERRIKVVIFLKKELSSILKHFKRIFVSVQNLSLQYFAKFL